MNIRPIARLSPGVIALGLTLACNAILGIGSDYHRGSLDAGTECKSDCVDSGEGGRGSASGGRGSAGGVAGGGTANGGNASPGGAGGTGSEAGGTTSTDGGTPTGAGGTSSGGTSSGGASSGGASSGGTSSGGTAGANSGGAAGAGGVGGSVNGCNVSLLEAPSDLSAYGAFTVGVRTIGTGAIGRLKKTEILYPAAAGSAAGAAAATYDWRDWVSPADFPKFPAAGIGRLSPVGGNVYRDLPIDTTHGPYPVVIFVHGAASFRMASLTLMAKWASRGFVVVAADHPGLLLSDVLCQNCGCVASGNVDVSLDVKSEIAALASPPNSLLFLSGHIDMSHVGLVGHGRGACLLAQFSGVAPPVLISLSGVTPVTTAGKPDSVLYVGGMSDTYMGFSSNTPGEITCAQGSNVLQAYGATTQSATRAKRLVGVTRGGYPMATEFCARNPQGRTFVQEIQQAALCGADTALGVGLQTIYECAAFTAVGPKEPVAYVTTAVLEQTLQCKDHSAEFAALPGSVPDIGTFQHQP